VKHVEQKCTFTHKLDDQQQLSDAIFIFLAQLEVIPFPFFLVLVLYKNAPKLINFRTLQ